MKWADFDRMRCKECGTRVVEAKMGDEEGRFAVKFECGRMVYTDMLAVGHEKTEVVECGWKKK